MPGKNLYLRPCQGKITRIWFPKNKDNLEFFGETTIQWCSKILKKTCIYDVAKAKSQYYDAQKIQIIYDFLLKSPYYDAQKY